MKRRVLVTGSRHWTDWHTVEVALREEALRAFPDPVTVVHGACPAGADACADVLARRMGLAVERHPVDWDRYSKAAGPRRNAEMVALGADVCLAFLMPDSRGTRDCMFKAAGAGIPIRQFHSTPASTDGGGDVLSNPLSQTAKVDTPLPHQEG